MRVRPFVVLLGSVVSGLLLIGPTAASAGSGIRFHAPGTLPGSEDGNEPSLAISNDRVSVSHHRRREDLGAPGHPRRQPPGGVRPPLDRRVPQALQQALGHEQDEVYVTKSVDGGATFGPPILATIGTNALPDSGCNTVPGGVTVDQNTGTVYVVWLSGNDVVSNLETGCNYSQIGPFDKAWVSTSTDGGLTWRAHLAWQGTFDPVTKIGDNADKIFGTMTVDTSGQVHVVLAVRHNDDPVGFVADCETNPQCREDPQTTDLLLATSPDLGGTWTVPVTIARGGSNFFPWVAGGSAGRLAVVYYSSNTLRPNDPSSVWKISYSAVTDAVARLDGFAAKYVQPPQVASVLLDPNPVHLGGICTFGIFCEAVPNADRSLADSIVVAIDPAGGANAAWTNNASGSGRVDFACQDAGPSLFAGMKNLRGCYGGAR